MRINMGEDEQPEIGLIALIDCIFFLLMFFMVATSFKQANEQKVIKELPIVLPQSSVSLDPSIASKQALRIGVDTAGIFYVDNKKVSTQQLHDLLKIEAQKNPGRPIQIDGDKFTPYKNIVHVLDICQLVGLTTIAMHTQN